MPTTSTTKKPTTARTPAASRTAANKGTTEPAKIVQAQPVEQVHHSVFPRRATFSRFVVAFGQEMEKENIPFRNLIIQGRPGSHASIHDNYAGPIANIYENLVNKVFQFEHEDLILMRAVKDDSRNGLTDKFNEICRVLEILLPRYKDRGDATSDRAYAEPLIGDPVLSLEEVVRLFLNENPSYIRRRISEVCQVENPSIPPQPEQNEIQDLEMVDGEWLVAQNSTEGIALTAAMNYTPAELRSANIPRFSYISRAMPSLREIADTTSSKNNVMNYVNGAGNAFFVYLNNVQEDESDIEALDLFGMYRNLRVTLNVYRTTAKSILIRLNNGKPAYRDLLNLVTQYRGTLFWGLEPLVRQTIPVMRTMFESPECQREVIRWLKNSGVLESYQKHKRFHFRHDEMNSN